MIYGQQAPQVSIFQPLNDAFFEGTQVRVSFIVSGTEPKFARVLVNDRRVQLLTEVKLGQNTVIVDVSGSDCKISIIALNDYGESIPAVVNLRRNEHVFKPTLYILAIGVSKYNDPSLQLQFSAKDAIDFSLAMVEQQGLLYEKVELRLLTDEQANAENIRDGLQWMENETKFSDVAMLYMAGHGINNNVGDFFFMPVNANVERINATCVSYREIKAAIDAIAGKTILFMDACHSGNVLGNNQQRAAVLHQAINDLTGADNGAVVFTSSTGRQFSLENPEWDNGAFTKALVEGLTGAADLFDKQTITINTLSSYIANRVKELTNGQQAPTTIIPNSVPDFPLAVVKLTVNITIQAESLKTFRSMTRKKPSQGEIAFFYEGYSDFANAEHKDITITVLLRKQTGTRINSINKMVPVYQDDIIGSCTLEEGFSTIVNNSYPGEWSVIIQAHQRTTLLNSYTPDFARSSNVRIGDAQVNSAEFKINTNNRNDFEIRLNKQVRTLNKRQITDYTFVLL